MIKISENTCDYCGTCVGVCPENCISLLVRQLVIDHDACTDCMKCVVVCPVRALAGEKS